MGKDAIKTDGGIYIRVDTDKRGKDHIDIYDQDPKGEHDESIHITLESDGSGKITTKSGDEPRETTDTQCFLTTACMKYFQENFDDNCYELTTLRWFRDNYVTPEDKQKYYEIAPIIVESIEKEDKANVIYDYIYTNVVDYCVEQIEQGNYDKAYSRYKNSVLALEEQIAKPALMNRIVKSLKLQLK